MWTWLMSSDIPEFIGKINYSLIDTEHFIIDQFQGILWC